MHSTLQTSRPLPPHPFPPASSLEGVICSFVFCSLERFPSFHLPFCWFGCTPQGLIHIRALPQASSPSYHQTSVLSLLNRSDCPCSCPPLSAGGLSSHQPLPSVGLMLSGGMTAGASSPGHEPRLHSLRPTSVALPLKGLQPRPHTVGPSFHPPHFWACPLSLPVRSSHLTGALAPALPFLKLCPLGKVSDMSGTGDLPAQLVGALQLHLGREVLGLSTSMPECMPDGEPQRRALGLRSVAPGGGSLGCRCTHR